PPKTTSERSCCCIVSCTGQRQRTSSRKSWSGRWTALDTWPRSSPTPDDATTRNCWRSSIRTRSTSTTPSTASSETNRTPLYDRHVALGGRMVDFGGWEMPQQYTSIRDEHFAVRKVAGLFDVSHMGRFRIAGGSSLDFLQHLVTNDLGPLVHGQAQYNLLCNEGGGIIDDLVVYRGSEGFFAVVNASNRERDLKWMQEQAPPGIEIEDRTFELGLLAFQGPRAQELLPAEGLEDLPYFGFRGGDVAGIHALISRTGYTGEVRRQACRRHHQRHAFVLPRLSHRPRDGRSRYISGRRQGRGRGQGQGGSGRGRQASLLSGLGALGGFAHQILRQMHSAGRRRGAWLTVATPRRMNGSRSTASMQPSASQTSRSRSWATSSF